MCMKSLPSFAGGIAVVAGLGVAMIGAPDRAAANETAPEETRVPMLKERAAKPAPAP